MDVEQIKSLWATIKAGGQAKEDLLRLVPSDLPNQHYKDKTGKLDHTRWLATDVCTEDDVIDFEDNWDEHYNVPIDYLTNKEETVARYKSKLEREALAIKEEQEKRNKEIEDKEREQYEKLKKKYG